MKAEAKAECEDLAFADGGLDVKADAKADEAFAEEQLDDAKAERDDDEAFAEELSMEDSMWPPHLPMEHSM